MNRVEIETNLYEQFSYVCHICGEKFAGINSIKKHRHTGRIGHDAFIKVIDEALEKNRRIELVPRFPFFEGK